MVFENTTIYFTLEIGGYWGLIKKDMGPVGRPSTKEGIILVLFNNINWFQETKCFHVWKIHIRMCFRWKIHSHRKRYIFFTQTYSHKNINHSIIWSTPKSTKNRIISEASFIAKYYIEYAVYMLYNLLSVSSLTLSGCD